MVQKPTPGYYTSHPEKNKELLLLRNAKAEDLDTARAAKNQLIVDNEGFLKSSIQKWFSQKSYFNFDEIVEDARLAFLDAIENYDLSKDTSIRTYARYYLLQLRRQTFTPSKFIELKDDDVENLHYNPHLEFEATGVNQILTAAINASLTPVEKEVVQSHFFDGDMQKEIAKRRGCSEARISTIIKNALGKLKTHLLANGFDSDLLYFN